MARGVAAHAAERERRLDNDEDLFYEYPEEGIDVAATRFGNVMRAAETYSARRYSADAVLLWTRLAHLFPTSFLANHESYLSSLEFLSVLTVGLSATSAACAATVAVTGHGALLFLAVLLGGQLLAYLAYISATRAAQSSMATHCGRHSTCTVPSCWFGCVSGYRKICRKRKRDGGRCQVSSGWAQPIPPTTVLHISTSTPIDSFLLAQLTRANQHRQHRAKQQQTDRGASRVQVPRLLSLRERPSPSRVRRKPVIPRRFGFNDIMFARVTDRFTSVQPYPRQRGGSMASRLTTKLGMPGSNCHLAAEA